MIGNAPATFTLAPRNTGPDTGSTVSVTDTLPVGFTGIAASGPNWSCSVDQAARGVSCSRASLPAGATDDITITATAPNDVVVPPGGLAHQQYRVDLFAHAGSGHSRTTPAR